MENWGGYESNRVPPGFRFLPTNEELIKDFLLRKSMGLPLPDNHPVLVGDIYGENKAPSEIFKNVVFDDRSEIYVLTRLSKINNGKTRIARTAGNGSWEGQTRPKAILRTSDDQVIGSWKMFSYEERNKDDDPNKPKPPATTHHWIMHEFSLDGVSLDYDLKLKDYVICRIKRKLVKENKKRSAAMEGETVSYNNKQHRGVDKDDVDGNKSMGGLVVQSHSQLGNSYNNELEVGESAVPQQPNLNLWSGIEQLMRMNALELDRLFASLQTNVRFNQGN